jgi:hypothetical protein
MSIEQIIRYNIVNFMTKKEIYNGQIRYPKFNLKEMVTLNIKAAGTNDLDYYLFYEKQDISPIRKGQVLERWYGEPVYNGMTIYYILKGDTGKYKYLKYKSKYLQLKNQNI